MILLILILRLSLVLAFKIQEIENPILPVQLGKTKIITSKHTFVYHINLTHLEYPLSHIKVRLTSLQNASTQNKHLTNFNSILSNKIENALFFCNTIYEQLHAFSFNHRTKRGLINGIGKVSKWLFGTLDSDDEQNIYSYLETLKSNNNDLQTSIKKQQTLLKELSETYTQNFDKLSKNQIILRNELENVSNKLVNIEQAFLLSNTIDSLTTQLNFIENLMDNLETAVTFARMNTLHSSIITPHQIQLIITKLNSIYSYRQVPKLENFVNYYALFSTQVIVQDKLILFKIHVPITSEPFKFFQLYPIPISNLMIIPEHPFLLLNDNEYWSTSEICPEIENYFYCQHRVLQKNQPCLANLIQNGANTCPTTEIHFENSSFSQINSNDVLAIPVESLNIDAQCDSGGIHQIAKPSIIHLDDCIVQIQGKSFRREETLHQQHIFKLPKLNLSVEETPRMRPIQLKTIDNENIKQINTMVQTMDINGSKLTTPHTWVNTIIILLIIIICVVLAAYLKRRRQQQSNTQKIEDPLLFSQLKEGGVM